MQFDLNAVETATLVFIGTLVFALVITVFMMMASFAALVLVGVGRLAWFIAGTLLLGLVRGINHAWDLLVHHASRVELPGDFASDIAAEMMGQPAPSTGTYPRVVLRDS
ncbi:hypothetical protein QK292_16555 [Arthrobacter sp. AL08]|uniref:hypothetical protein n=1 Tax=Micrococcaceae TaxID=1268 RepID=UPI001CFFD81B|nr:MULTISPECIES: hypothetical protein [Micrococcaceae]MCB5281481.1 hypothetical protein [Arthrobacter sp. ES1]MDD1476292.1 hypothetical protein [Arthrobacter sp. H16F315]MDI3243165.1 hypothetical protein [Arthrobacter sp. AL05]MDI3279175.1 hypothetical protein [Arthrobacter sp. AL08]MDJ0354232.1 hypothetical protein [Pseudarthrobacter sp. PH31-O2]